MYKKLLATTTLIVLASFIAAPVAEARGFSFSSRNFRERIYDRFENLRERIEDRRDSHNNNTPEPTAAPTATAAPTSTSTPKPTSTSTATPKPTQSATPNPTATPTTAPSATPSTPPIGGGGSNSFNRALVTLTFDDASQSQFLNGWPVMQKYGMKGTFYMTTGSLDGYWYMIPDQIKQLYNGGNHIAAHTLTHANLTTVSSAQLAKELAEPQAYLQNLIGAPVADFATPYGAFNTTVINAIKNYYRSHRGVDEGLNSKSNFNIFNLLVRNVYNTTTAANVTNWVNQAKQSNSWLILVYHEVKPNPDQYSVSPEGLDAQLKAIQDTGVSVVTLDQAINELVPQL